jgi:hypothetical protein
MSGLTAPPISSFLPGSTGRPWLAPAPKLQTNFLVIDSVVDPRFDREFDNRR